MSCLHGYGQSDIDRRITTGIGRYVSRADKGLSLAITECVTCRVVKKFYSEGRARCAVQTALNIGVATTTDDRGDHRIILQIIWSGIDIATVVGLDAVGVAVKLQVDPEARVREDGISKNGVVDGAGIMHPDAGETGVTHRSAAAVKGDDVTRATNRAAYGVAWTVN
jgi:hypothetical protein